MYIETSSTSTEVVMLTASNTSSRIAGMGTSITNTIATPITGTTQSWEERPAAAFAGDAGWAGSLVCGRACGCVAIAYFLLLTGGVEGFAALPAPLRALKINARISATATYSAGGMAWPICTVR